MFIIHWQCRIVFTKLKTSQATNKITFQLQSCLNCLLLTQTIDKKYISSSEGNVAFNLSELGYKRGYYISWGYVILVK